MKQQDVYGLIDRFEASDLMRMRVKLGDMAIELERMSAESPCVPNIPANTGPIDMGSRDASDGDGPCITAPMVGTFYVAPAPDKDPYVQPGDTVKQGDTVCLLEAMKMMCEVTAPCDCTIERIAAADGELVSFGAPLVYYRKA